ncbi:MAG: hypothetical protein CFH06_01789, partial [Alphaproteobacteria bacterium MarineAlpha3_Bin5]
LVFQYKKGNDNLMNTILFCDLDPDTIAVMLEQ